MSCTKLSREATFQKMFLLSSGKQVFLLHGVTVSQINSASFIYSIHPIKLHFRNFTKATLSLRQIFLIYAIVLE